MSMGARFAFIANAQAVPSATTKTWTVSPGAPLPDQPPASTLVAPGLGGLPPAPWSLPPPPPPPPQAAIKAAAAAALSRARRETEVVFIFLTPCNF
jgi:hypothetical protein